MFKYLLKNLKKLNYIVVLEGNNYVIKEQTGKVFAETSCFNKNKENWLLKCYTNLLLNKNETNKETLTI